MLKLNIIIIVIYTNYCFGQYYIVNNHFSDMHEVFSWKQLGFDVDGVKYTKDESQEKSPQKIFFQDEVDETQKFFVQYNNIPIGFEVYQDKVFITVPRRRYGIFSTLNYVDLNSSDRSPLLKPYPDSNSIDNLISVYRPRVDVCGRLWMVDTGLLEVPDNFQQKKAPQILIYDLKTDKEILRYPIPSDVLVNRTTSGLTSITVDVTAATCDDAYAYINDLTGEGGLVVFSLKQMSCWRFSHSTFTHDVGATDFTVAHEKVSWRDGLFSIALTDADSEGRRKAYYHPLISTQEFSISNDVLKNSSADFEKNYKFEGVRGAFSQSGSHDYHSGTKTLLLANVAQDGILCWNTKVPLTSKVASVVVQSHTKLVYITDLKVIGDDIWVLVNQIPRFIYSKLNTTETNFYLHRGKVEDLIKDTGCDK